MTALAWSFAAITFALWLIEHRGGKSARDRLRTQRDEARAAHKAAEARAFGLGIRLLLTTIERDNARAQVHPSGRLAPVRVHGSGATVIPIQKGER